MDEVKQQVADRLKQAANILVTVKTDPSIDLLAACLGLSLVLDKVGKHATAVFSGQVPSVMEFLKPEETIEKTPNSLRDFIISLDKSKADKLRYKVEDKVVRIFITPFKAGLTQEDLEFSQGDFNIDLLVALGVHEQAELDAAVTAHGRILHDAAIISINTSANGNLGTLNWQGTNVSSVSEMIASLAKVLDPNVFDEQIATALLTGIVAETARFSNDKTSPGTMQLAGELMAAGANQQLVATELQGAISVGAPGSVKADIKPADDNGTLEIKHDALPPEEPKAEVKPPEPAPEPPKPGVKPDHKVIAPLPEEKPEKQTPLQPNTREILPMPDPAHAGDSPVSDVADTPFTSGGDEDNATTSPAFLVDKVSEVKNGASGASVTNPPLTELPPVQIPALTPPGNDQAASSVSLPAPTNAMPVIPPTSDDQKDQTLAAIEKSVGSPHTEAEAKATSEPSPDAGARVDDARQQVLDALKEGQQPLQPIASLNAQPLGAPITHDDTTSAAPTSAAPPDDDQPAKPVTIEVDNEGNMTTVALPTPAPAAPLSGMAAASVPLPPVPQSPASVASPPPVPPPMMPGNFGA